jgi:hypothetical protein
MKKIKKINERISSGVEVHGVVETKKKINEGMTCGWIFESEGKRGKKFIKNACDGYMRLTVGLNTSD